MTALLVAFAIVLVGCRIAVSMLPPGARSILSAVMRGFGKFVHWVLFGTGYKGGM